MLDALSSARLEDVTQKFAEICQFYFEESERGGGRLLRYIDTAISNIIDHPDYDLFNIREPLKNLEKAYANQFKIINETLLATPESRALAQLGLRDQFVNLRAEILKNAIGYEQKLIDQEFAASQQRQGFQSFAL